MRFFRRKPPIWEPRPSLDLRHLTAVDTSQLTMDQREFLIEMRDHAYDRDLHSSDGWREAIDSAAPGWDLDVASAKVAVAVALTGRAEVDEASLAAALDPDELLWRFQDAAFPEKEEA